MRRDLSSLLYWYPKVEGTGVPMPKTTIVRVGHEALAKFLYGEGPLGEDTVTALRAAADSLGYPLFVRTDQASFKHEFATSSYVERPEDLISHIYKVLEFNEMADMMGLPYEAIVLREFLQLESRFKAFGGLPIARERRYFIKDGQVRCHHPYWPEHAIEQAAGWSNPPLPADWKERLRRVSDEPPEEVVLLSSYAEAVARELPGYWSVDFARSSDGPWYFIDAAEGALSWHPAHDGSVGREPLPDGVAAPSTIDI